MSELQDLFEKKHPMPKGITRCGDRYAQTEFVLCGDAGDYCAKFKGFAEAWQEQQKRITNQGDFIEITLSTLNHLKENAVTYRDYGHECNWARSFNDLIKLASDAEDSLKEALRGGSG